MKLIIYIVAFISILTFYNINEYRNKTENYNRKFKLTYWDKRFLVKNEIHNIKKILKYKT